MPNVDIRSLSVCIQALGDAIRYYELLAQSETTDSEDYEECKYMYEVELSRMCEIYAKEEKGLAPIPLKRLLKKPLKSSVVSRYFCSTWRPANEPYL